MKKYNQYYWENKKSRTEIAKKHTEEMEQILSFYENKQQEITTVPFLSEILSKLKPVKNIQSEQSASFNELFNEKLKNIRKERTEQLEGWREKEKDKHE